jgi:hypothetical protein
MPLPLLTPPDPVVEEGTIPIWSGPEGQPVENSRFPVSPPPNGSAFLTSVPNWLRNPSLETNSTDWSAILGSTLVRDRSVAMYGAWALKVNTPNAAVGEGVKVVSVADPNFVPLPYNVTGVTRTFIGSIHVLGSWTGMLNIDMDYELLPGHNIVTATRKQVAAINTRFQRVVLDPLPTPAGSTPFQLTLKVTTNQQNAANFWVDGAMIVESQVPVPYFDGDVTGGDSYWTGTAQGSVSQKFLHYTNNQTQADWFVDEVDDWTTVQDWYTP